MTVVYPRKFGNRLGARDILKQVVRDRPPFINSSLCGCELNWIAGAIAACEELLGNGLRIS